MNGFIYLARNKVNGQTYVGQTTLTVEERWSQHVASSRKRRRSRSYFHDAIAKYGTNNFEVTTLRIVEACDEETLYVALNVLEMSLIETTNSHVSRGGYNIRSGGDNAPLADESKQRISESVKTFQAMNPDVLDAFRYFMRGKKHSSETIEKMSRSRSGEKNPNWGKPSPFRGKKRPPEMGRKVSATKKRLGQGLPQACKDAQLKAIRKQVACYTIDGVLVKTYDFIGAVVTDGFSGQQVSRCVRSGRLHKGFIWKEVV